MWPLIFLSTFGGLAVLTYLGNKYTRPTAFVKARAQLAQGKHELVDGAVVTLVGVVQPIDLLTAPLTGRKCVALHVKAFLGPHWLTRFAMTRFVLATDQGEVFVEHWPEPALGFTATKVSPAYDIAARFLQGIGYMPWDAARATFEEIAIEPGARIAVHGVIRTELAKPGDPDLGELGFREVHTIVKLVGDPKHPLAMGDP